MLKQGWHTKAMMKFPFCWTSLVQLGNNSMLRSSFVWLIIVPIVAKSLERSGEIAKIVDDLEIALKLPFNWYIFYFSAVLIACANALYLLRCPKLVKEFRTYGEFQRSGQTAMYLMSRWEELGVDMEQIEGSKKRASLWQLKRFAESEMAGDSATIDTAFEKVIFAHLHHDFNQLHPISRTLCSVLYALGLIGILWVAVQNFVFVVELCLSQN